MKANIGNIHNFNISFSLSFFSENKIIIVIMKTMIPEIAEMARGKNIYLNPQSSASDWNAYAVLVLMNMTKGIRNGVGLFIVLKLFNFLSYFNSFYSKK